MGNNRTRIRSGSRPAAARALLRGCSLLGLVGFVAAPLGCTSLPGITRAVAEIRAPADEAVIHQDQKPAPEAILPAPPAEPVIGLAVDTPVIPSEKESYAINLATAMDLAGANNPTIALAQEAVQEALALQLQARALLFPSLNAGGNYNLHRNALQTSSGQIRDIDRQALYFGGGAGAVGAGTVAYPGVRIFVQLADAIYAPKAAEQDVINRRFTATAQRNSVLLDVATQYLRLLESEGELAVIRQSEVDFNTIVGLTAAYYKTGQGRLSDADRAKTDAGLLHNQEQAAEEAIAVAAADLARLLDLAPSVQLRIVDEPIQVFQLVDSSLGLEELLNIAARNRPEVGAAGAAVAAAQVRYRQEKVRPFVPLLSVGYSEGVFGGGANELTPRFGNFNGRSDFDASAIWTLQGGGFGTLAVQKERKAEIDQAATQLAFVLTQVKREVADAFGLSAARLREAEVARRRVQTALEGFKLDLQRIRAAEGLPLEVLNSAKLLAQARRDLVRMLVAYDQAQFQLFVALGQPPVLPPGFAPGSACPLPLPGRPGP